MLLTFNILDDDFFENVITFPFDLDFLGRPITVWPVPLGLPFFFILGGIFTSETVPLLPTNYTLMFVYNSYCNKPSCVSDGLNVFVFSS